MKIGLTILGPDAVPSLDVKYNHLTSILQDYKDIFKGLGYSGYSSFQVDPTALPVQHTSRPTHNITELSDLTDLEKEMAPIEWISNVVVIAESHKICICFVPGNIKKSSSPQIITCKPWTIFCRSYGRPRSSVPLMPKDGFCQICLDEASSKLTTFLRHFGHYRFFRMPFAVSLSPEDF